MTPHLPERSPLLPAERQGLFRKFNVSRVDGSDRPGGKHHGCDYFVLDVTHDKHAKAALRAYADAVEPTHPVLAADMRKRYGLVDLRTSHMHSAGCIKDLGAASATRPRNEVVGIPADSTWQFPASRTWCSGPPPHIGWWNASTRRNHNVWRWWDGHVWSFPVAPNTPPLAAARQAELKVRKHHVVSCIEWTDHWPANARVPRTPTEGTCWTLRATGEMFIVVEVHHSPHRGAFIYAKTAHGDNRGYHGYDNWLRDFDPVGGKTQ